MIIAIKPACLLILIMYGIPFAQTIDTSFSDQLVEDIIPEPGIDYQEFNEIDDLDILLNNPVNINTADINALQKIPGLDLNYSLIIIQHRDKYGQYFSPYELYSIKEIPKSIVKNILPFISIADIRNMRRDDRFTNPSVLKLNFRTRSTYNLHDNVDTIYNKYQGSKIKLYNRLSLIYNSVEFGLATGKDPGEKSYFDFWSSYLMFKKTGPFDHIILGDFRYESGLGLILGETSGYSKTMDASNPVKKKERLIQPFNSSNENGYYRGAAFSLKNNKFQMSAFYSNQFKDASTDSTSKYITNLITSGYHRTLSEINNKNRVHEIIWGIRTEYSYNKNFNASLLFCRSYFSKPFYSNIPYSVNGNRFNDLSSSYDYQPVSTIYMNGEFAYDFNSIASLNSLQISLNKDFLFFSSIRSYPRNFISLSGHSLAEQNGKVHNETGFYNGFKLTTGYGTLIVYYDQFKFPFGLSRSSVSNSGEEFLLRYSNYFSNNTNINISYKYENKDYILNDTEQVYIGRRLRNDLRLITRVSLFGSIDIKTIIEYNSIRIMQDHLNDQGILLSNSFSICPIDYIKVSCSFSLFKTASFYSSVYEYDEYISGLVTGRVLYGEGLKLNLYLRYQVFHNVYISAQYSEMFKPKEILVNPPNSIITNNIIFQLETGFN